MVASPTSTGRTDLDAALDVYERENGFAPTRQQGLDALQRRPGDAPAPPAYRAGGYVRRMPIDPWGQAYRYDPERPDRRVWSDLAEEHCPARNGTS